MDALISRIRTFLQLKAFFNLLVLIGDDGRDDFRWELYYLIDEYLDDQFYTALRS